MQRVFDVHAHYPAGSVMGIADRLNRPDEVPERKRREAVEALLAQCEAAGIAKTCLLGGWGRMNGWVLEACRDYPGRFVPMAFLDLDAGSPEQVSRLRDEGFSGVKAILPRKNYDDPSYMPHYEALCRLGMPILFHTGVFGGSEDYLEADPKRPSGSALRIDEAISRIGSSSARMRAIFLDTIAAAYPELRIVGAHLGYGEYDLACAVARWRRNAYFDLSGGEVLRRQVRERGLIPKDVSPDKLCFGSDCATPRVASEVAVWRAQLAEAGLGEADIEKVMWGNAAWIFGVERCEA
jgi:predicted TIM-barrel fold metal-dependent hydrolase